MSGSIVAHGGGELDRETQRRFAELCGHGDLVLVPTAHHDSDRPSFGQRFRELWMPVGFDSISLVHARDRAEARRRPLVKRVRDADCVWFGGGAQGRLMRRYVGTPVQDELRALLARGGVVGGFSAGTAVLTDVMIHYGNPIPVEGRGLDLLPGVILDQHFVSHRREPRLRSMLERHPELIGFGIDERTSLVISRGRFEILGESLVRRCTHSGCTDLLPGASGVFPGVTP
ncbi:MAG: cyanophycinase [Myxococcales bacterium]|nr:cyanophycinase [Myxococcales bacterium]